MNSFQKTLFLLVGLLILPFNSLAFQANAGENLVVTESVTDDFYGAGASVQVNADIQGDLTVAGGDVSISGKVEKDLITFGGDVRIDSDIEDDLHAAGGNLYISSQVNGDAMVAGGTITIEPGSSIGGDLLVAGGDLKINGEVQGNFYGAIDHVYIDGVISGNVKLYGVGTIEMGPNGRINGNINYSATEASSTINSQTVGGAINFEAIEKKQRAEYSTNSLSHLTSKFPFFSFIALLIFGLFAVWTFKYYLVNAIKQAYEQSLASFGSGLFIIILTPILAILALLTGIGYLVSFALFLMWLAVLLFAGLAGSAVIGFKILPPKKEMDFWRLYAAFAIGALIYTLLGYIPYVGYAAQFVISSIGVGAMALYEMELGKLLKEKKLI